MYKPIIRVHKYTNILKQHLYARPIIFYYLEVKYGIPYPICEPQIIFINDARLFLLLNIKLINRRKVGYFTK